MKAIDLTGLRYGRLVVRAVEVERKPNGRSARTWTCDCDCGGTARTLASSLISGETKSCGCLKRQGPEPKHGYARKGMKSPEYTIWVGMKNRCLNPNDDSYRDYGGRGITVCDEWRESFERFLADMGPKPSPKHSIDRVDNNGPYAPWNCRWATMREQALNRRPRVPVKRERKKIDGDLTAYDIAEAAGVDVATIRMRHRLGYQGADLYAPTLRNKYHPMKGRTRTDMVRGEDGKFLKRKMDGTLVRRDK